MTRVILVRHAKSDWGQGLPDHDRPLNDRGERAADAVGAWLAREGYRPDLVLCSDATRTRQTSARIWQAAGWSPEVRHDRALYHAAPEAMLAALREAEADCIALVAHNPGTAMLAAMLVRTPPDHPRFEDYPTAATTVLDFENTIEKGHGTPVAFIVPRDLE